MLNIRKKIKHSFAARFSSSLLLLVGLIFSITFLVSFLLSNSIAKSQMEVNANLTLQLLNKEIENVLEQVEGTPENLKNIVLSSRIKSDDIYKLTTIAVKNNPSIYGSAIAFEPNYFPEQGYYFSPYSWRVQDTIYTKQLGSNNYPYFDMDWYSVSQKTHAGYWSNSYYDKGGGNAQMITYSSPIIDSLKRFAGVFTADLSLIWLNELLKNKNHKKQTYIVIIGRDNTVLATQKNEEDLNPSLFSVNANFHKDSVVYFQHEKEYAYYTYIPQTGWTIFFLVPTKVMYGELFLLRFALFFIGVLGLMLTFIFSVQVIKRFLKPLKHFSLSAKQIAHGQLDIALPKIKSEDEIAELSQSFSFMQSELLQYIENLKTTTAEKERVDSEIRVARELQLGMLPKKYPNEVDLYAVLHPAKLVGGDLYDFFVHEQKLYFILGDVAGKGIPAAILMAVTMIMFRSISSHTSSIDSIVKMMNKTLTENNEHNIFVTLFAGILDLKTGNLQYCNAGHDPSIIINNDAQYLQVMPNLPIGAMPDYDYRSQTLSLNYGETLFLYTDGVTEAENKAYELYGTSRLLDCIRNHKKKTAQSLVETVLKDVKLYIQDNEPSDDLTILAIRRKAKEEAVSKQIVFENKFSEIATLQQFVESFCHENDIHPKLTMQLNLSLEEVVSNIIRYAYPETEAGKILLTAARNNNELVFTVTDYGICFDPTQQSPPDLLSPVEERPIGGLGIFLVQQIMDEVNYERIENSNYLTLKKIVT